MAAVVAAWTRTAAAGLRSGRDRPAEKAFEEVGWRTFTVVGQVVDGVVH